MRAFAKHELVVPAREFEGRGHFLVCQGPVAELVIEIVPPVLQEHPDFAAEGEQVFLFRRGVRARGGFRLGFADIRLDGCARALVVLVREGTLPFQSPKNDRRERNSQTKCASHILC